MGEETEEAQVSENVEILASYQDADLLATLKQVLEDRPSVVQELVDWAVPDRAYVNARLLLENRICGTIKSFSETTGYGFIDCPEVKTAFGNDVFLHASQIGTYVVGQEVSFAILLNKERKPQAFDLGPAQGGKDLRPMQKWGGGASGAVKGGCPREKGGCVPREKGGSIFGKMGCGTWSSPTGGMIRPTSQSPATWNGGGAKGPKGPKGKGDWGWWDMWDAWEGMMHKGDPWQKGDGFMHKGDGWMHKGKGPSDWSGSMGKGKTSRPPRQRTEDAGGPPDTAVEMAGVTDRQFEGHIKSFSEAKGFGFIACDDIKAQFGGDVFLHHRQKADFQVGQKVIFNVFLNKDHKPQAKDLVDGGGAAFEGGADAGAVDQSALEDIGDLEAQLSEEVKVEKRGADQSWGSGPAKFIRKGK